LETTDPGNAAQELPYPYRTIQEILNELVDEILAMNRNLQRMANISEGDVSVCFVIDGDPLPAKGLTHQRRARQSYSFLKRGRKMARLFLGKPAQERARVEAVNDFCDKFGKVAAGWIRWFPEYKDAVAEALRSRGFADGFDLNQPLRNALVVAKFEADPVCVWIGHIYSESMLFSNDSDLLAYPAADNSIVRHSLTSPASSFVSTTD